MGRGTAAASRMALCFALAGWAHVTVSFVVPSMKGGARPDATLRGTAGLQHAPEEAQAQQDAPSWAPTMALVASVGLAVTMLSAPVQAEDGVEAQGDVTAQYGKLTRKKKREEATKEAIKAEKPAAGASGGFSLPSLPVP